MAIIDNSDRVLTLLDILDLKERYIDSFDLIEFDDIDYSKVKHKFDNMISYSKQLLIEALDIQ